MTLADSPHSTGTPRPVERVPCSAFADVVQLMRYYPNHELLSAGAYADRDNARQLVDKRLANAGHPLPGTAVVTSRQGRLLAFHGDITRVDGLSIEFTTGGRLPLHRLVAVGIG